MAEVEVLTMVGWVVYHSSETHISPTSPQLDVPDAYKFIIKILLVVVVVAVVVEMKCGVT